MTKRISYGSQKKVPKEFKGKVHIRTWRVAERDGWVCWLCGQRVLPNVKDVNHKASKDHVKPKAEGGPDDYDNLRLAHRCCNEFRAGQNVKPYAPFEVA